MKPFDHSDLADATPLDAASQRALEQALARTPRRRAARPALGSLVGLGLSLAFVAGLALLLTEPSPVARELRR
ncbi:hypothetical protein [Sphingomonas mesophila]|uniref:hypothetical protein n=1 Tax=Sphingomonas mesophila TaxID=2303576 RepID=UPI0013C2ABFF|nr:hypothetical protein [Sphingomonas mesophila]